MTVNLGEGDLYVAPFGSDDWRHLGRTGATTFRGTPTQEPVDGPPLRFKPLRIEMGWVVSGAEMRRIRRRFLKVAGPRPLAPGCLPASKLARRRWR